VRHISKSSAVMEPRTWPCRLNTVLINFSQEGLEGGATLVSILMIRKFDPIRLVSMIVDNQYYSLLEVFLDGSADDQVDESMIIDISDNIFDGDA
jgi:hypothetical protein